MKKFEAIGSLTSCQISGRPSTAAVVVRTLEQTAQFMLVIALYGECSAREVLKQTGVRTEVSGESTANNFVTVSLQVPT
ncbi:hypothetical protein TNCV_4161671 [Trichonephila clavipes]|nr:hypothetical protein TNCV_4161671 [Trichonephila clavipes]